MGTSPSKLICRRHYGFVLGLPFREGIDDEASAYYSFGEKMCEGWMKWMVKKVSPVKARANPPLAFLSAPKIMLPYLSNLGQGDEIDKSTSIVANLERVWKTGQPHRFTDTLYSCAADDSPERHDDPGTFIYVRFARLNTMCCGGLEF